MPPLCYLLLLSALLKFVSPAPASGFVFPDDRRKEKKLEPVISPPVLPYIEHLERDPSTLLPNETGPGFRHAPPGRGGNHPPGRGGNNPRFGNGFNVKPSGDGGLTASFSGSAASPFGSQSAAQSFSFGFNQGFSASHSASQSASFSSGFGNGGFSGSQASSQAASFSGSSAAAAASSAAAFAAGGHGGHSGSQSASSAFGFNSINGLTPPPEASFGDGLLDIRHRGAPDFFFPSGLTGRSKGVGAATFRSGRPTKDNDDFLAAIFVSD